MKSVAYYLFLFTVLVSAAGAEEETTCGGRRDGEQHCASQSDEKVVYLVRHGEKVWVPPNETAYAYACLSEQGWARAYHLQGVFGPTTTTTTTSTPVFQTPEAIFSYNYHNAQTCRTSRGFYRTQATAAPLAALLDLHIDNSTGSNPELCGMSVKEGDDIDNGSGRSSGQCVQTTGLVSFVGFGPCCNVAAAAKIKNTLLIGNHLNQTVNAIVVAWEHFNLAYLAKALGANNCDDQTLSPGCNMTWPSNEFDYIWALYFDAHTGAYLCIDTTLRQGFEWIGPTTPGLQIYNRGPGEHPGID